LSSGSRASSFEERKEKHMAKVKPYIVTVKFAAFYEDPRPTVDQVLNELNVDALEVTIEDAIVSPKQKVSDKPDEVVDVESRTVSYHEAPVTALVEPVERPFTKAEAPFDTFNLDREGPSIKILSALYGVRKGRKLSELRQVTSLQSTQIACTITRLKKQGRIVVSGTASDGSAIYVFVK
jgi:hypothetical protein